MHWTRRLDERSNGHSTLQMSGRQEQRSKYVNQFGVKVVIKVLVAILYGFVYLRVAASSGGIDQISALLLVAKHKQPLYPHAHTLRMFSRVTHILFEASLNIHFSV